MNKLANYKHVKYNVDLVPMRSRSYACIKQSSMAFAGRPAEPERTAEGKQSGSTQAKSGSRKCNHGQIYTMGQKTVPHLYVR